MIASLFIVAGIIAAGLVRRAITLGLIESPRRRRQLRFARAMESWTLREGDGITPIRPGERAARQTVRPGGGGTRGGASADPVAPHGAEPGIERAPARHAGRDVHPGLLLIEQHELQRAGFEFAQQHPDATILIHGRQGDKQGQEILN